MTASEQSLRNAISTFASMKELSMNQQHLLLDILALSKIPAFAEDEKFNSVLHIITKDLLEIIQNPAIGASLKNDFAALSRFIKNQTIQQTYHMMTYVSSIILKQGKFGLLNSIIAIYRMIFTIEFDQVKGMTI